jgi:type I restriction enzyme R subunit
MQQGLEYAATLDIPFVFSSNGDGFVFHDRTGAGGAIETNLSLDAFPPPDDLWARYAAWKGLTSDTEKIVLQDYFDDGSGMAPQYYQVNAVNAAIETIAKGRDRILLVMATGTGKTYTAFQIIWRLWKAGQKKRILFLADRNIPSTRRWSTTSGRSVVSWRNSVSMTRRSRSPTAAWPIW